MNRIDSLTERLKNENLDGLLLVNDSNIRYMTGFTGSDSYAVISAAGRGFITDSRYTEQAEAECDGFEVIRWRSPAPGLTETIMSTCNKYGIKRLGFEKEKVTYGLYEKLAAGLSGIVLVPTSGLVEDIRYIKDKDEIGYIRRAAQIADEAFEEILKYMKIGVIEKDIERELQYLIKKKGADDIGFPIIVAAGKRSSLPHAIPSDKKIEKGDFITLDFGAMYKGYRSDMTRTVVVGGADERQKEIYSIVKAANEAGENAIKAGVSGKVPDDCARGYIRNAGYGDFFGHGLGHGVGLDIHEEPFMSSSCEKVLAEGNVITVEPGIYLPDWGGVRIEDTVLVKADGIEILTRSSKELIELK
ncbi:MAG TPA: Xaa-Pro peptidase family protein [Candidatus Nitrosocosmicus sp.]|nr:Xaa-Pro peptidase family protein [Candidatus Nitrosocosmicus sp.]